jgi:HNH endonuclease
MPLDMLRTHDPVARFEERIAEDKNGCWIWQSKIGTNGRAIFKVNARTISVHRWAYEHYRGPIPDGLVLDHLCKTPLCVNPDHLEAVTVLENNRRARTHCFRGHLFGDETTVLKKDGKRICRICENERRARYRQRSQEKQAR